MMLKEWRVRVSMRFFAITGIEGVKSNSAVVQVELRH